MEQAASIGWESARSCERTEPGIRETLNPCWRLKKSPPATDTVPDNRPSRILDWAQKRSVMWLSRCHMAKAASFGGASR